MRIDKTLLKNLVNPEPQLADQEWSGAVVFLCTSREVFFIMRSLDMPTHKGQVGFFGGHKKTGETPFEAALREFREETSLSTEMIEPLGALRPVITSSGKPFVPIVCYFPGDFSDVLNNAKSNGEWSDVFIYPWEQLCEASRWSMGLSHGLTTFPVLFHTLRRPYLQSKFPHSESYQLWGATALMVWQLVSQLIHKES
ncbi:MAG TPA: NUDIX domain-containing protein [Bacteriovoracaceae bacterium]|nr:NUDIX domain-containing protein [Bacteriovoracaceae bacterium]